MFFRASQSPRKSGNLRDTVSLSALSPPPTAPPRLEQRHASCELPSTASRRFAPDAGDVCLVGAKPTCSIPTLWGCEDHTTVVLRRRPYVKLSTAPGYRSGPGKTKNRCLFLTILGNPTQVAAACAAAATVALAPSFRQPKFDGRHVRESVVGLTIWPPLIIFHIKV